MKISYKDGIDPRNTDENPFHRKCIYCATEMVFSDIEKLTIYSFEDFKKNFLNEEIFLLEVDPPSEEEWANGTETYELSEDYFNFPESNFGYDNTILGRCTHCGWWKIIEEYTAVKYNLWQVFFEIVGAVKNFDLKDISTPIEEIRSHLIRRYEDRFIVNPRLFEQTVSTVFKDIGYNSVCTAYSNDGGIDVILTGKGDTIAVQVKRTKNKIGVEQIRSFLGALMVNNHRHGLYISTSDFQSGCDKIAKPFGVELINGATFFNVLREAQIINYSPEPIIDFKGINTLYFNGAYPLNSL